GFARLHAAGIALALVPDRPADGVWDEGSNHGVVQGAGIVDAGTRRARLLRRKWRLLLFRLRLFSGFLVSRELFFVRRLRLLVVAAGLHGPLHVRLARRQPNFADQDVVDDNRVFAFHGEGVGSSRREFEKSGLPGPVLEGLLSHAERVRLVSQHDADFLAGIG